MSKILSGLVFLIILAGPAMAAPGGNGNGNGNGNGYGYGNGHGHAEDGPAPEVDGGIAGLMLAGGVVYLINRRKRSKS